MPREGLMRAQTPHTFPLATLRQMMKLAKERGIKESQSIFTLAGELGIVPLYTAQGDLRNFKITEQPDILIYRALKTLEE
jgi:2-C-methyl-D-erythritol 4-phosphate cytidylyltransferase